MKRNASKRGKAPEEPGAVLRGRAEERLKQRQRKGRTPPPPEPDARRLLHDLEVHQAELEIQNEELHASRLDAEAAALRYAEIYEFAPIGYATLAEDRTIRAINLAGARVLGKERKWLVGRPLEQLVRPEDREIYAGLLEEALATGEEGKAIRELALCPGTRPVHVRLSAALLFRVKPEFLVAIEDVSERKQREQERAELLRIAQEERARAEEANRTKDAFLATLSHELRNPLTPIRNCLSILERSEPGSERARRAAEVIQRQVSHMSHLVDDLLDVSRITRGKVQLQRRRLDLNDLARSAVEDHRSLFERDGVRVELAPAPGPVVVEADWDRLAQVVGNLLQNAAKFTHRGGAARIAVARDEQERCAVVSVTDDGVGMESEMLGRLFQPFAQADKTRDRSKGGLGLGMALAKDLVELHGGRISAESAGVNRGARFDVRLPLATGEAVSSQPPRTGAANVRRRVLVIEDNVDAGESLRELLELQGHEVAVARDGRAGVEMARELRPEIVLCDLGLPGMDGCEVARILRGDPALAGTYLVALSGYALPDDVRRATECGFQRHVAKPPDPAKLQELLDEAPVGPAAR